MFKIGSKIELGWVIAYEKLQRENAVLKASERRAKETADELFEAKRRIAELEGECLSLAMELTK